MMPPAGFPLGGLYGGGPPNGMRPFPSFSGMPGMSGFPAGDNWDPMSGGGGFGCGFGGGFGGGGGFGNWGNMAGDMDELIKFGSVEGGGGMPDFQNMGGFPGMGGGFPGMGGFPGFQGRRSKHPK
jgi:hypothetical protein